jgi:pimeloyl-ACP methyl ester carboxylesterase
MRGYCLENRKMTFGSSVNQGASMQPTRISRSPDDAFDVVAPSLPGFGFSSKPNGKPIGLPTVARLWNRLMTEVLGYPRYGAQGGDIGRLVTVQLALSYKDSLLGVHFNGLVEGRLPPPEVEQTPDERAWRRALDTYNDLFGDEHHGNVRLDVPRRDRRTR